MLGRQQSFTGPVSHFGWLKGHFPYLRPDFGNMKAVGESRRAAAVSAQIKADLVGCLHQQWNTLLCTLQVERCNFLSTSNTRVDLFKSWIKNIVIFSLNSGGIEPCNWFWFNLTECWDYLRFLSRLQYNVGEWSLDCAAHGRGKKNTIKKNPLCPQSFPVYCIVCYIYL